MLAACHKPIQAHFVTAGGTEATMDGLWAALWASAEASWPRCQQDDHPCCLTLGAVKKLLHGLSLKGLLSHDLNE